MDITLLRLQYEILNKPLSQIGADEGLPTHLLEREAQENGWAQMWPDPPPPERDAESTALETMTLEAEQYIEVSKKRLKVYSLAKEILLAQRYLALESKIIETAYNILDNQTDLGAQGAKQISALFKDLTTGSNLSALASMTLNQDEPGRAPGKTSVLKELSALLPG